MVQAVPLVVLGVFATVGIVLFIGGCAVTKNWYPMFVIIPAILVVAFTYLFVASSSGSLEGGWIRQDGWLFLLIASITSCVGLPLVFFHCKILNGAALGMHLAGDAATGIGFGLYLYLSNRYEAVNGY